MKNVLILFLVLLIGPAFSQDYRIHGSAKVTKKEKEPKTYKKAFPLGKKIHFKVEKKALSIQGYSGSDVLIETYDYQPPPERAKGLRALYNTATDNSKIGLQIDVANGIMTVESASHNHMHFKIKVPSNVAIQIEESGWEGRTFELENVKGEIEIDAKGSRIDIKGAQGPIVANTTSGDILIVFDALNQQKPSSISNTSGFIDVALPTNTKANLTLKSISGEIYTDHNLQWNEPNKKGLKAIFKQQIQAKLNNGGVELSLQTISDHIYLRKK